MKRLSRKVMCFFVSVLFIVFFNSLVSAQIQQSSAKSGTVKGYAFDAQTKRPIEAVNFVLISIKDTSVLFGAATDKDGMFMVKNIPFGIYNAKISCIGYKTRTSKGKSLNPKNPVINLDTILLAPKNFSTGEVQITAQKERIAKEENKYIIRPERELGNNALEQLENAPLVSMDVDDNLTIAGKKVTIYIDGQPAKLHGIEKTEDLKIISNIEIEKFELIIDPNSEYEETKNGAVINIVTRKTSKTQKYSAYIGGDANSKNKLGGGFSAMYSAEKYSAKGRFLSDGYKKESDNSAAKTLSFGNGTTIIEQTGNEINDRTTNKVNVTLNYIPEFTDIFTGAIGYTKGKTENKNSIENKITPDNINGYSFNRSLNQSKMNQEFWTAILGYSKTFKQKGRRLNISLAGHKNKMTRDNDIDRATGFSYLPDSKVNSLSKINSDNTNSYIITRSTYRHPFTDDYVLTINGTVRYVKLGMANNYFNLNPSTQTFFEDTGLKTDEKQKEFNCMLSSGFDGKLLGVKFGIGFGYESKIIDIENIIKKYNYNNNFSAFSPGFNLRYELSESTDLGMNYSRLYIYPMNQQLSPFTDITDSTNFISGNPNLKPSYIDGYALNYSYQFGNSFIRASVDYNQMKDMIERVTEIVNGSLTRTTYKNVAKSTSYGASGAASLRTCEWLSFDSDVGLSKIQYEGAVNNTEGWRWKTGFKIGAKISPLVVQFNGNYYSASYSSQGKNDPVFKADGVIKALFFNKDLALTFRVSDIFNSLKTNGTQSGDGFVFINKGNDDTRIFSISLSYYFQSKAIEDIEDGPEQIPDEF